MAKVKECICCGKKIGILVGSYFDGQLCDECYIKCGGSVITKLDSKTSVDEYVSGYQKIERKIDEQVTSESSKEKIKALFSDMLKYKCKDATRIDLQGAIQKQKDENERELKHIDYAKSLNEFYEYDVVTLINENHGTVDKEKMMKILSDHARAGWKLHTIYSNELGKNALNVLGFGMNATACEDVLIFERRVQELDS